METASHFTGRRGGRTARDHLRRPVPRCAKTRERAQGVGRGQGRCRRDLPADDPRGSGGDACVRTDRRAPQRRVRSVRPRGRRRADGGFARQGAHHCGRRASQGQDGAGEGRRRCRDGRRGVPRAHRGRAPHRHRCANDDRFATCSTTRSSPLPTTSARRSRWRPSTRCSSSTRQVRLPSRRASSIQPAAT